ncbi:MAG: GNAT family N-acetyltransferase [Chlamydiia bacterium]|nr:GNAT family N-acetyltransferase [Chlamydiia bacterium]
MNNFSVVTVEFLEDSILAEARAFLKKKEDFSLFLLGNLEAHGTKLTKARNSGNFKLIRVDGQIIAVFSLTKRGVLIVQSSSSEDWILDKILDACLDEGIPILGLLGEWHFCKRLWNLFKKKEIILKETLISKEILYAVDVSNQGLSHNRHVRFLTPTDYQQWKPLRIEYLKEEGLPNDLSDQQLHELFLEKVEGKISWGYFLEQSLVAMAELNAMAADLGQVGGVYTAPIHRKKGFAKSVMHQLMRDAKNIHEIRKLIIFTGEKNHSARKLYESLDTDPVGYYALMFGSA